MPASRHGSTGPHGERDATATAPALGCVVSKTSPGLCSTRLPLVLRPTVRFALWSYSAPPIITHNEIAICPNDFAFCVVFIWTRPDPPGPARTRIDHLEFVCTMCGCSGRERNGQPSHPPLKGGFTSTPAGSARPPPGRRGSAFLRSIAQSCKSFQDIDLRCSGYRDCFNLISRYLVTV